jgi:hypothetical protein
LYRGVFARRGASGVEEDRTTISPPMPSN